MNDNDEVQLVEIICGKDDYDTISVSVDDFNDVWLNYNIDERYFNIRDDDIDDLIKALQTAKKLLKENK